MSSEQTRKMLEESDFGVWQVQYRLDWFVSTPLYKMFELQKTK